MFPESDSVRKYNIARIVARCEARRASESTEKLLGSRQFEEDENLTDTAGRVRAIFFWNQTFWK